MRIVVKYNSLKGDATDGTIGKRQIGKEAELFFNERYLFRKYVC